MTSRIAKRVPLKTRVSFEDERGQEFQHFVSSNISLSGIFIETDLPLKTGTKVFLKFNLPESTPPIRTAAEVTRLHEKKRGPGRRKPITPGIGLRFLGLSREDFARIEDFMTQET